MKPNAPKAFRQLLAAAGFALGALGTAQAAYVVVKIDPAYGPAYPNLGWRAIGALYVPTSCVNAIGTSTTTLVMATDALCSGAKVQDVKLSFYDLATPSVDVETLNIGTYGEDLPPADALNDLTQQLLDISFSGGKVSQIHTSLSLPTLSSAGIAGNGIDRFSLDFSTLQPRLFSLGASGNNFVEVISGSTGVPTVTISDYIADDVYNQNVPEPASWALALAALAGAAGAGRLRRAAAARG